MKNYIYLLIYFLSLTSFSQTLVSSIPLEMKKNRDVFQIVNESRKEVTLFLSDKTSINAVRLDDKIQIIDSLSTTRPEKKYSEMIGFVSIGEKGSNPKIFWSTGNRKELFVQNFNFENHKVDYQNYTLALKNEELVQEFTANKKFYIMTIVKKTNDVKLYVFDSNGGMEEKTLNFDSIKFFTNNYSPVNFYEILDMNLLPFESAKVQKIIPGNPISLTESAKKRKLYIQDKEITFTIDTNVDYTQLISINLETYVVNSKTFRKAYIKTEERYLLNSNSFLIDDKLFQLKTSSSEMFLNIKDMNDATLNEFYVAQDKSIDFKNTDVIQEVGDFTNKRVLEKSSQFLRKVNNSNSGISCYKMNDNYIVTVGSVSKDYNNNSMMYGAMFGAAGVIVAAAIFNPTYDSFNSYANRKVIYTNGLFDLNANHLSGEIKPFAFDNIRTFLDNNKSLNSKTLFKLNNAYYLGYYDSIDKKYSFRKFQD